MAGPFFGGAFFGGGFFGAVSAGVRGTGGEKRGRKRELIVRMSEVTSREDTAEFLKSQLRLKHLPDSPFVDTAAEDAKRRKERAAERKREAAMRGKAAKDAFEAQRITMEAEQKKATKLDNANMTAILLLAAASV